MDTISKSKLMAPFFIVFAFVCSVANAQTFSSKTFTTDNGLSHNYVQHITQDKTGFLWISTWDGINRFDGYEFKNYYHKPNDPTSVPFFVVDKAVVDASNTVWAMCQQRPVVVYDRNTDCFKPFSTDDFNEFVITDITLGPDSTVWLLSQHSNELYHFDSTDKLISTFQITDENGEKISFENYPQLLIDNKCGIWLISIENHKYEVFRGETTDKTTLRLQEMNPLTITIDDMFSDYKTQAFYDINVDDHGNILIFSKFGLYCWDTDAQKFTEHPHAANPAQLSGKPFYFWSDKTSGIHIFDTNSKEAFSIVAKKKKFIENVFVDSQNTVWVADSTNSHEDIGLSRFMKTPSFFKYYLSNMEGPSTDVAPPPASINDSPDVWIAMRGLDHILKIKPNGNHEKLSIPRVNGKLPLIYTMAKDPTGLWIGCTDNCLLRYDFAKNEFNATVLNPVDENDDKKLRIHNILLDNENIIINGFKGIYKYNTLDRKLAMVYKYPPDISCFCMINDGQTGYWIGINHNTIKHLNNQFNEISTYRIGEGMNNVEHICIGDSGDVWVALMGGGLGHVYTETGKTEVFTTSNGLVNNTVLNILKDKKGYLWISTNKGISMFNPHTRQFRSFRKTDGMLIEEFNSDAHYLSPDGQMFFGGVGGVLSFYPENVATNNPNQGHERLLVTEFKVSGIPRYFDKPVYELDRVTLHKGDNNFQVYFARLDFNHPDQIKYRYRLAGINSIWTETDHRQRNINCANLNPGIYKVEIEASNIVGEWDRAVLLTVVIPPFYYQTLWFRILAVLLLVATVAFGFVIYTKQIRLASSQKQNVLRLESLRGQMNPHFIFNSLNSINYFISNNNKLSANHYIADFSRLIRSFLDNLSSDYIPFENEVESLKEYLKLEHLRFADKFDYVLKTNQIEDLKEWLVVPGLVQPFIENAIWHGIRNLEDRKGLISIVFMPVDKVKMRCIIEDDGVGRQQASIYKNEMPGKTSKGIGIVMERLEIIGKINRTKYEVAIEDCCKSKENCGTRIKLDLPIKRMS
jgi:ligand-binding sensor domain-containing protein